MFLPFGQPAELAAVGAIDMEKVRGQRFAMAVEWAVRARAGLLLAGSASGFGAAAQLDERVAHRRDGAILPIAARVSERVQGSGGDSEKESSVEVASGLGRRSNRGGLQGEPNLVRQHAGEALSARAVVVLGALAMLNERNLARAFNLTQTSIVNERCEER
jgi:hypothetical protein